MWLKTISDMIPDQCDRHHPCIIRCERGDEESPAWCLEREKNFVTFIMKYQKNRNFNIQNWIYFYERTLTVLRVPTALWQASTIRLAQSWFRQTENEFIGWRISVCKLRGVRTSEYLAEMPVTALPVPGFQCNLKSTANDRTPSNSKLVRRVVSWQPYHGNLVPFLPELWRC